MARRGKPLKTVTRFKGAHEFTRLKPGENESSILRRDLILLQFSIGHLVRPRPQDFLIESDQIHPQSHPAAQTLADLRE